MNLTYLENPFPHVLIDGYFSEDESAQVWAELDVLSNYLRPGSETLPAVNPDGSIKKQNSGIFLADVYKIQLVSPIFKYNRKIFSKEVIDTIPNFHYVFKYFPVTNSDSTLIQFYKNGDYYKPHHDGCLYTLITLFHKTPKAYSGGILKFGDYEVNLSHNQAILFPSCTEHEVTEIVSDSENFMDNRISISTLIGIVPPR